MIQNKFDILWYSVREKRDYTIGYLFHNENSPKWQFIYNFQELNLALKVGFALFPEFINPYLAYKSEELFYTFKSRIPSLKRTDLLSPNFVYDEFELLKVSKPLVTDHIKILYQKDRM